MMDSPREPLPSLPDNAEALRALVLAALAERDAAVSERDILLAQNDRLRHLLLKLTRMHFGARSERLPEEQLQLGLEALEQAIARACYEPAASVDRMKPVGGFMFHTGRSSLSVLRIRLGTASLRVPRALLSIIRNGRRRTPATSPVKPTYDWHPVHNRL